MRVADVPRVASAGRIARVCVLAVPFIMACDRWEPLPRLEPTVQATLATWLTEHGKPPTDYVVGLFEHNDVVFVGEVHRVKHDVRFVQALLKPLAAAGVRTVATEFARREDQSRIDSLLAAPEWDEQLGREIVFDQFVEWGYQEYVDLFRAAWELNQGLAPGEPPLRILGVNDSPDWSQIRTRQDLDDAAVKAKVWRGGGEHRWADVILSAVGAGQKVLVYAGIHHAFTAFHHPIVVGGKAVNFEDRRMGNYVFRALGKRTVTVFLHAPWPRATGMDDGWEYPAGGYLDALMLARSTAPHPVGFDLAGSPFDGLPLRSTFYASGNDSFRLSMFCDGWVYTKPIAEYEGVTPIANWINAGNVARARLQTPNPAWREDTPAQFNAKIARGADLARLWGRLR